MKLALEALQSGEYWKGVAAINALRDALAEQPAQQEAQIVRWNCPCGNEVTFRGFTEAPASKPWVGLTDEQVIKTFNAICNGKPFEIARILELHKAIEAAHGIKGEA